MAAGGLLGSKYGGFVETRSDMEWGMFTSHLYRALCRSRQCGPFKGDTATWTCHVVTCCVLVTVGLQGCVGEELRVEGAGSFTTFTQNPSKGQAGRVLCFLDSSGLSVASST